MLTDKQRIEYSLIPALLESYIIPLNKIENKFDEVLKILEKEYRKYINGNYKLFRRMDRIANKIIRYTVSQKFDSRKAIIAVAGWLGALGEADAILLEPGEYWNLIEEIGEIIHSGYDVIDDFEKIQISAAKHITMIHKLAQEEGYFN